VVFRGSEQQLIQQPVEVLPEVPCIELEMTREEGFFKSLTADDIAALFS